MKARMPAGFGRPDMNALMRQAQKMQEDMKAKQAELEAAEYTGSAAGEMVTVKMNGKHIEFAWGDDWRHHETRQATLTFCERYERVRWQWDDEDDESFVEIRMERSSLSGQYTLHVTDFVSTDDLEWLQDTWSHNFERLRRTSGV